MTSTKKQIDRIKYGNYGVRSGVYSAVVKDISMEMDAYGEYQYMYNNLSQSEYTELARVDMMSDLSMDENELADQLFSKIKGVHYESVLGYHQYLGIGHVIEGDYRARGSSGGLTTWVLDQLLRQKKVDYIIHTRTVNPSKHKGKLFKYVITNNSQDLQAGAKSNYYPMELSEVLEQLQNVPGRYAVVAIPEFITEMRLLSNSDPVIKKRLKYMIGLVCGHQKSARYVDALAWQHGISPGMLQTVDFRVKKQGLAADDYLQKFISKGQPEKKTIIKKHHELFADNWPLGFFKSNFSDYTDNVFNELADITLGDAWLEEYNSQSMGNNIVIVRNSEINNIIQKGIKAGALSLDTVDPMTIKKTQSGLIRHARDELPYRLFRKKIRGQWVPKKRIKPSFKIPALRRRVQTLRLSSAKNSHTVFKRAMKLNDYHYFEETMAEYIKKYDDLYERIRLRRENNLLNYFRIKLKVRTRLKAALSGIKVRARFAGLLGTIKQAIDRKKFSKTQGAIITLSGYYNYGNIIQRYALQKFLQKNGLNFVSYWNEQSTARSETKKQLRYMVSFVRRHIITKQFDPRDKFSTYIVGSDQVWRNWSYADIRNELGYYFLNFAAQRDIKRIAYSASIGQDSLEEALIDKETARYVHTLIKKFNKVSIRESSGVDIIEREWGVEAENTIDPTLLLYKEDYTKLIDESPYKLKKNKNTIFTYFILSDDSKRSFVDRVITQEGLSENSINLETANTLPPPEAWLIGIRDAKLVIADSFHGVVFSIIFNKPFLVVESGTGGSSRITSLLAKLGLEDRYVSSDKIKTYDISNLYTINWDDVNIKLERLRKESGKWLISAIEE